MQLPLFWKENFDRSKQRHQMVAPKNILSKNFHLQKLHYVLNFQTHGTFLSGSWFFAREPYIAIAYNIGFKFLTKKSREEYAFASFLVDSRANLLQILGNIVTDPRTYIEVNKTKK